MPRHSATSRISRGSILSIAAYFASVNLPNLASAAQAAADQTPEGGWRFTWNSVTSDISRMVTGIFGTGRGAVETTSNVANALAKIAERLPGLVDWVGLRVDILGLFLMFFFGRLLVLIQQNGLRITAPLVSFEIGSLARIAANRNVAMVQSMSRSPNHQLRAITVYKEVDRRLGSMPRFLASLSSIFARFGTRPRGNIRIRNITGQSSGQRTSTAGGTSFRTARSTGTASFRTARSAMRSASRSSSTRSRSGARLSTGTRVRSTASSRYASLLNTASSRRQF